MSDLLQCMIGLVAGVTITIAVFFGIDAEVARSDYNENVAQCKPIDNCLFSYNCKKYNKMIEKECEL